MGVKLDLASRTIEIANAIRLHGNKRGSEYILSVRHLEIIIDGRIAEEYEDLEDFAPCQIDYLGVSSDSIEPWFNMFTAFNTGFPLMSNDKYNFSKYCAGEEGVSAVYQYVQEFKTSKDKKRLRAVMRAKWLKTVKEKENGTYLKGVGVENGCSLSHAVDCSYTCHDTSDLKGGVSLEVKENHILKAIGKTEAFFIRVQYPDLKSLLDMGYLAWQDAERAARFRHIIPKINDKVNSLITKKEVNRLIEKAPNKVIFKGRLKGDPKPKLRKPAKIKAKDIRTSPDFGNHPNEKLSWGGEDGKKRIKYRRRVENKIRRKLDKLDIPRFELILPFEHGIAFRFQIQQIVKNYNIMYDKSNYARFYNGTADICLPSLGAKVIDHYDEDKTPYALGDLVKWFDSRSSRRDSDISELFFRVKYEDDKKGKIVTFSFISNWSDNDWDSPTHSGEFSIMARNLINASQQNPLKSQRTGMTYMRKTAEARISPMSIKNLWNYWG